MPVLRSTWKNTPVDHAYRCFECAIYRVTGYLLLSRMRIGDKPIFICDQCLKRARAVRFDEKRRAAAELRKHQVAFPRKVD